MPHALQTFPSLSYKTFFNCFHQKEDEDEEEDEEQEGKKEKQGKKRSLLAKGAMFL